MEKTIKLFLDCEFTGLVKDASLISLALYKDDHSYFYAEFNDYDKSKLSEWHIENVISKLEFDNIGIHYAEDGDKIKIKNSRVEIIRYLKKWLTQFERIEIWGDVPAYDWVFFCELFGGALFIPANIFYIQFDLATVAKFKGLTDDFSRFELVKDKLGDKEALSQHNALSDAKVGQLILQILNKNTRMGNENLYKRLIEYRIDFAYSKGTYYVASDRLRVEYEKKEKFSHVLNIVAASLSIFSLTALQLYINKTVGDAAIYVASFISLTSVIVSIYLFFHKNSNDYLRYLQRADEYTALYKRAKDIEAKFLDKIITSKELAEELEKLNLYQQKINALQLPTIRSDYDTAKKGIDEGETTYTELEIKTT